MVSSHIWLSLCVALIAMLIFAAAAQQPLNMATTPITTKPGCPRQCGNLTIPYPFGIGMESGCSMTSELDILCATSFDPPKAFLPVILVNNATMVEVLDISDSHIRVRNEFVTYHCYNSSGMKTTDDVSEVANLGYVSRSALYFDAPYRLSATANTLTVVGCNDKANVTLNSGGFLSIREASNMCPSNCYSPENVVAGPCNGEGCCEASIPDSPNKSFRISLDVDSDGNHTFAASWNPCGYAFIGERGSFTFRGAPDLNESRVSFVNRIRNEVPVVLDWVAEDGSTCTEAKKNMSTYLCKHPNTVCVDVDPVIAGIRCGCQEGYQGNPYLSPGCTDINECELKNNCSMGCINTAGSYHCYCPSGYSGDGRKDGTGCKRVFPKIQVALGASFGSLILIIGATWMSLIIREKRLMKRRSKFFQQNGGYLLKQLLPSDEAQSPNIFTIKELMVATNNFSEESIVGKGGYGTVYKGILPKKQVVAIKKSKILDESQIEQFINEFVLLTRLNHPNVVKVLGCCLEAEVPLLVYEYISNGTLYDQIHAGAGAVTSLSWSNCLRIAIENAKALAYLHSIPIIHRDIKSTNILLDENHTAKISDFGISRLIPMDKTRMATLVQGTLGYLDPEYFFSSELTNKSDVYSFGVVLAELLTRESPLLDEKLTGEKNLSVYFVKSLKAGRLIEIVDPEIAEEASQDQLLVVGELIQSCLSVRGDDRPTMKEVAMVLESLCKFHESH